MPSPDHLSQISCPAYHIPEFQISMPDCNDIVPQLGATTACMNLGAFTLLRRWRAARQPHGLTVLIWHFEKEQHLFSRVSAFLMSAFFSYQRTSGSPVIFPLLSPFSPPFLSYICRPKFRDLSSSDLETHSDVEHFSYKNISCARNPLLPGRIIHGHHVFYILRGLNFNC